jgi:hypothetical protein
MDRSRLSKSVAIGSHLDIQHLDCELSLHKISADRAEVLSPLWVGRGSRSLFSKPRASPKPKR